MIKTITNNLSTLIYQITLLFLSNTILIKFIIAMNLNKNEYKNVIFYFLFNLYEVEPHQM